MKRALSTEILIYGKRAALLKGMRIKKRLLRGIKQAPGIISRWSIFVNDGCRFRARSEWMLFRSDQIGTFDLVVRGR